MRLSTTLALLVLLAAGGCRPDDQETQSIDPVEARAERSPELLAVLDSGSAAYRSDDYGAALEQYTRATELQPDEAAGWFGIFMAQHALGNMEAANEALERARSLAPGASLIHPTTADTVSPDTVVPGGEGGRP